jgi:hypothetical protein
VAPVVAGGDVTVGVPGGTPEVVSVGPSDEGDAVGGTGDDGTGEGVAPLVPPDGVGDGDDGDDGDDGLELGPDEAGAAGFRWAGPSTCGGSTGFGLGATSSAATAAKPARAPTTAPATAPRTIVWRSRRHSVARRCRRSGGKDAR